MQFDTNSNKLNSKNVSKRARRSKKHRANTSNLKKSKSDQKANYSKNSSNQSFKRCVKRDRRCSKNVKTRQMNQESPNVVQTHHVLSSSLDDTMIFIKKKRIQCLIDFFFLRSLQQISTTLKKQNIQRVLIFSRLSRTKSIKQSSKSFRASSRARKKYSIES